MDYLAHSARLGKPSQSYEDHVKHVFVEACRFASEVEEFAPKYKGFFLKTIALAAEYHDLGKLDSENQAILLRPDGHKKLPINHVDAGVAAIQSLPNNILHQMAALLDYSHHIGLPDLCDETLKGSEKVFRDIAVREDGRNVRDITDKNIYAYLARHKEAIAASLCPQEAASGKIQPTPLSMRIALSCLVDADHSDTSKHYGFELPDKNVSLKPEKRLESLDKYITGLGKNGNAEKTNLRNSIYSVCRNRTLAADNIIACDSPVGTGKTTAVMAHLLQAAKTKKMRHIFVVLPFTNIINQSVAVYRKSLILAGEKPDDIVVAQHHRVEFSDLASRAFSSLWRAPVTVTTAVSFFETLASNHPASLRKLHEIAGSAIFIDESHAALPAKLWPLALKWLRELASDWGCYIVLGSGSLSRFWELQEFSEPSLKNLPELINQEISESAKGMESARIAYHSETKVFDLNSLIARVNTKPGPRLLILNTVQSAAAVARELQLKLGSNCVEHLSTALAPVHRELTLERVRARLEDETDNDWTLVATSCVEAGVDISFRTAFRESCGLVNLIQTGGRVNRNSKYPVSEIWDFKIKTDNLLRLHPMFAKSSQILMEMFAEGRVNPENCTEALRREIRAFNFLKANDVQIVKSEMARNFPYVDKEFKVIDSYTVTVLVDKDIRKAIEEDSYRPSIWELQNNSVQIWENKIINYGIAEIKQIPGLNAWTLAYDGFLGYMKGVLENINFQHGKAKPV
ncbi:MAG TPA: CRISPR-associated protein [Elusimicrobia bacterium]|nr:CRISPR-associated protein [Elusimicrobiota bacterium]